MFCLVLFAALSVASLCRASPSLLVGQLHSLLYVVLVLPHPSPPRLVSLPICLCRVALFFLTLRRVGRRPLLCAHDQFFCAPSLYSLLKGFPVRLFFQLARLGFCALEVSVSLGGVVLEPVLAHQSLLWLSLLLSWLAPSFSCLRV